MENRRQFIQKMIALNMAGLAAPSMLNGMGLFPGTVIQQRPFAFSGLLSKAILMDCFKAVREDQLVPQQYKAALKIDITAKAPGNYGIVGHMASTYFQGNKKEMKQLLREKAVGEERKAEFLAVLCGFVAGLAMNEQLVKDMELQASEFFISKEQVEYEFDALLLWKTREFRDQVNITDLEILLPRTITRWHTLIPDEQAGDEWVVAITKWRKKNLEYLEKLADTYNNKELHMIPEVFEKSYAQYLATSKDAVLEELEALSGV